MRALTFVGAFVAVTLPLVWCWMNGGFELYARAFIGVATWTYDLLGLERAVPLPRQRYINAIPFIGLMLITPSLGWRRRSIGLVVGLLVLFVAHLVFNALAPYIGSGNLSYPTGLALLSDALPFLIWAAIAREWIAGLPGLRKAPGDPTGPGSA